MLYRFSCETVRCRLIYSNLKQLIDCDFSGYVFSNWTSLHRSHVGCLYSSLERPEGDYDGDGVDNDDDDNIGNVVDDGDGADNGDGVDNGDDVDTAECVCNVVDDGDNDTDINSDQPGGIRGAGPKGQVVPNPRS